MALFPPYPVFLHLQGAAALIVGGGRVGLRKAKGLIECGATVTVVSPVFDPALQKLPGVRRVRGNYAAKYMGREKWRLVFAATDLRAVNEQVAVDARKAGIACCRCDLPEAGDFSGGAVVRLGEKKQVTVAVGTAGASPALAAGIARAAAAGIGPESVALAELMGPWRKAIRANVKSIAAREALMQALGGAQMEETLARGGAAAADSLFEQWLKTAVDPTHIANTTTTRKRRGVRRGR